MPNKSFIEYFTDREIIYQLCKYRLKHASKRHKIHMMRDVSSHPKTNLINHEKFACPEEIRRLLPARRTWSRLHESKRRQKKTDGSIVQKDANVIALQSLFQTVLFRRQSQLSCATETWISNLNEFIQEIQDAVSGRADIHLCQPTITPLSKGGQKKIKEYRPIASYSLKDRLIISLCSSYLMTHFDDLFKDCSHAFRKKKGTNHHSAIRAIKEYKSNHLDRDLWVTECDIQKFYDCVNHREAKKAFFEFSDIMNKLGKPVHERASDIFYAYLSSYCFNINVHPLSKDEAHFSEFGVPVGVYKWIQHSELYPEGIESERIGVPQGGALSCLIANLLLHKADLKVFPRKPDPELLYIRYCDDMIIVHPSKRKCQNALNRYKKALTQLKLPYHHDQQIPAYGRSFWSDDIKSKPPYLWSTASVPWLNFVGYQMRPTLEVRVRRRSVIKEIKKQRRETNRVLKAISALKIKKAELPYTTFHSKKSAHQLIHSLRSRLISMSVGKVSLHNYKHHDYKLCWTSGFEELTYNKYSCFQMSLLDRTRGKQLRRLKRILSGLKIQATNVDENGRPLKYYGTPFSYFGFLLSKKSKS